jgi:DNA polymerase-1
MQLSLLTKPAPTPDAAPRWQPPRTLPSLQGVKRISWDCETSGLNPFSDRAVGFSLALRRGGDVEQHYLPVGHSEGNLPLALVQEWAARELPGKDVVFANAKFDVHFALRAGIDFEAIGVRPHDVAFKDALLDDERVAGHGLDQMAARYCGEGKMPFPGAHMDAMPSWRVAPYAMHDARVTLLVDEATDPLIREQGLERVLALEDALIYCTCHIERVGSRIDVEKLDRWRREAHQALEGCLWQLHSMTGLQINPTSPEDLMRLCRQTGVPIPKERTGATARHPQGQVSFTDEVVERLAAGNPAFAVALRARRVKSLLVKFLDKFWDSLDGDVLRAQYHQMKTDDESGTVSGRYSSAGGGAEDNGYSFNAQQTIKPSAQKKDGTDRWTIRRLFIPADGMRYFAVDAKQIEYRLFGHFAGAQRIIDAYNNDELTDMHQVATDIAAQHAPQMAAQWGAKFRDHVKNVNFARLYGARPKKIASMLGITERDAEAFVAVLDKVFPEAAPYLRRKAAEAEQRGFVTTLLGRRARFTSEQNRRGTHSAVNRVIQGTAADLMKLKMLRVYNERKTLGITAIRQTIHDELDGDVLPDPVYERRMAECFAVQEVKLKVPLAWSLALADNWLEAK